MEEKPEGFSTNTKYYRTIKKRLGQKSCPSLFFRINGVSKAASSEINRKISKI